MFSVCDAVRVEGNEASPGGRRTTPSRRAGRSGSRSRRTSLTAWRIANRSVRSHFMSFHEQQLKVLFVTGPMAIHRLPIPHPPARRRSLRRKLLKVNSVLFAVSCWPRIISWVLSLPTYGYNVIVKTWQNHVVIFDLLKSKTATIFHLFAMQTVYLKQTKQS